MVVFLNQMAADAMISAVTAFFHNRQVQDFGETFRLTSFAVFLADVVKMSSAAPIQQNFCVLFLYPC